MKKYVLIAPVMAFLFPIAAFAQGKINKVSTVVRDGVEVVKIETDEGIFGWGESGLSGREKAVVGAIEHYAEWLVGKNPFNIGQIWQALYRSQYSRNQ